MLSVFARALAFECHPTQESCIVEAREVVHVALEQHLDGDRVQVSRKVRVSAISDELRQRAPPHGCPERHELRVGNEPVDSGVKRSLPAKVAVETEMTIVIAHVWFVEGHGLVAEELSLDAGRLSPVGEGTLDAKRNGPQGKGLVAASGREAGLINEQKTDAVATSQWLG